jgi:hypothetical protein
LAIILIKLSFNLFSSREPAVRCNLFNPFRVQNSKRVKKDFHCHQG